MGTVRRLIFQRWAGIIESPRTTAVRTSGSTSAMMKLDRFAKIHKISTAGQATWETTGFASLTTICLQPSLGPTTQLRLALSPFSRILIARGPLRASIGTLRVSRMAPFTASRTWSTEDCAIILWPQSCCQKATQWNYTKTRVSMEITSWLRGPIKITAVRRWSASKYPWMMLSHLWLSSASLRAWPMPTGKVSRRLSRKRSLTMWVSATKITPTPSGKKWKEWMRR